MQRSIDRHSDRYVPCKKFTLRQICDPALLDSSAVSILRDSSLCFPASARSREHWVLFGARLKIPDLNLSAKDYPRDITISRLFPLSLAFIPPFLWVGDTPSPSHSIRIFDIFSYLSFSHHRSPAIRCGIIYMQSLTSDIMKNRGIQCENHI